MLGSRSSNVPSPFRSSRQGSGEWRLAVVSDEDPQLKVLGQLSKSGEAQNVSDVAIERPIIIQRVVTVEAVAEIVAHIARIGVRSEKLPAPGEPFFSPYQ